MIEGGSDFNIGCTSGAANVLLRLGGQTRVYSINLSNGSASLLNNTPNGPVSGMAVGLGF